MKEWLAQLDRMMIDKKKPDKSIQMEAYMKHLFQYYGITAPERKEIVKYLYQEGKPIVINHLRELVDILWLKKQREYQYVANDLLKKQLKQLSDKDLPWIESLIVSKSWWDTVDFLAPTCLGTIFKKHPTLVYPNVERWMASGNKWLIRSSMIFQLKYKNEVDTELLFELIRSQIGSKEFFINKAAGWSLRQLARFQPELVVDFVNENTDLANLTKREALKHFT